MKSLCRTIFAIATVVSWHCTYSEAAIAQGTSRGDQGTLLQDVVLDPKNLRITATSIPNKLPFATSVGNEPGDVFRAKILTSGVDAGAKWHVELHDGGGNSEIVRPTQLAQSPTWYSRPFLGNRLYIRIEGPSTDGFGKLEVTSILRQATSSLKAQSAGNPILSYSSPALTKTQKETSKSVAKLEFGGGHTCSGFFIGPTHIVTNRHCVNRSNEFSASQVNMPRPCGDVVAILDYVSAHKPSTTYAKCVEAWIDPNQDLGVLRVEPVANVQPMLVASQAPTLTTKVYSVGHPLGLPLTFTRCCGFFDVSRSFMGRHDCPTFSGGSGSPILDEANQVVAVSTLTDYDEAHLRVVDVETAIANGGTFLNTAVLLSGNTFIQRFIGK